MSKLNDERIFRNFLEMNVVPRLERYREELEKNGTTWDNPNIIMSIWERTTLFALEEKEITPEKHKKLFAVHEEMRRKYETYRLITGGIEGEE